jgi:hypothetical protein
MQMHVGEFQSTFNAKINTMQVASKRLLGGKPPYLSLHPNGGYVYEKALFCEATE